jgi:RES domain-containing protein
VVADPTTALTLWRLVKARHAASAFDGEGARRYGGRWNSPGVRVAYASESASLAVLEVLVHLQSSAVLSSYALVALHVPPSLVEVLDASRLPPDWRASPPPVAVQALGDAWVRAGTSPVLRVPSVLVPIEANYVVNPAHPAFGRLRIGEPQPFTFDARLAT